MELKTLERTAPFPIPHVMPELKFDRSVSLLCWALNEEECIEEFLEKAVGLLEDAVSNYEIILVDDGSTDRTFELARNFQQKHPQLRILQNDKNRNVSYSYKRAIKAAKHEFIFCQTLDWSYDLSKIRIFLEYSRHFDLVVGVRREPVNVRVGLLKPVVALVKVFGIKHLSRRSDTIPKALVSVINFVFIRLLFKTPVSDFQNIVIFKSDWLQKQNLLADSSFISPEILIKAYWSGLSLKEVPINFIARTAGDAKGTRFKSIVRSVTDILSLWWRWRVLRKDQVFQKKGTLVRMNPRDWAK